MKHLSTVIALSFSMILTSCGGGDNSSEASHDLQPVLDNIHELKGWSEHNPIEVFLSQAQKEADESIELSKSNMEQALYKAKSFEYCFVVVDNHTIVKIDDLENCRKSGSWGACMPYAEGYIQKGKLIPQSDYINNIIGRPDLQQRVMFLFQAKTEPEEA